MLKANEATFVDNKELRDECMNRIEVLEKVKDLFLIPGLEMMTTKQVADYFEVETEAIRKCFKRNKGEVESDGVRKIKGFDAVGQLVTPHKALGGSGYAIQLENGEEVNISTGYTVYFSRRAVLRIAMLLRDSEIAKEVRTQLLNTFEQTSDVQRTADIDEEQQLYINVGKAMASGDWGAYQLASVELIAFKNRKIAEVEEENLKLQEEKDELTVVNSILAKNVVAIKDPRKLLIYLVNVYGRLRWAGKTAGMRMRRAYNDVYGVMLNNEPHIDLRRRQVSRKTDNLIDCIDTDEFCYAISAVMGLILYYNNGLVPEELLKNMAEIDTMIKEAKANGCVVNVG